MCNTGTSICYLCPRGGRLESRGISHDIKYAQVPWACPTDLVPRRAVPMHIRHHGPRTAHACSPTRGPVVSPSCYGPWNHSRYVKVQTENGRRLRLRRLPRVFLRRGLAHLTRGPATRSHDGAVFRVSRRERPRFSGRRCRCSVVKVQARPTRFPDWPHGQCTAHGQIFRLFFRD